MATEIGILAVRRSILINAPPERVWQEFESYERMKRWFGLRHSLTKYEPHVGGAVETTVEHEGSTIHFGGPILVFDPPHEVTWSNDWFEEKWAAPSLMTFRLTATLGGTLVELFHHAIERVGESAAEMHRGFEGGWEMTHLEALRELIEG